MSDIVPQRRIPRVAKRLDLLLSTSELVESPVHLIFLSSPQRDHQIVRDLPCSSDWNSAS
jgi:hypothetical protein